MTATLAALGWLGLQIAPPPFLTSADAVAPTAFVPRPTGQPVPVERSCRQTYGDHIPEITSAVITGWASIRPIPGGPVMPARFRFIHQAGRNDHHDIQVTWFSLPILRVDEAYLNGVSIQTMPWPLPSSRGDPRGAHAATLDMWAETTAMPAVFLTEATPGSWSTASACPV